MGENGEIRILIIEDDLTIGDFLQTGLKYEGYSRVDIVHKGCEGLEMLRKDVFDLVILDIMLPDVDGFHICRSIRSCGLDMPILILTVKRDIADRVKGLDEGADDYLIKPFSFEELLARIRALLRRKVGTKGNIIERGNIILNRETHQVYLSGKMIGLTPTEFSLLEVFMSYPEKVFTREVLLNRVLGYNYEGGTNIIDVHINHLRKKLQDRPPSLIRTIYGIGYAFYPQ